MNYIRQFVTLLGNIFKQFVQLIFDRTSTNRKPSEPVSPPKESFSFTEAAKRAEAQSESEHRENILIVQNKGSESQQPNTRRKSKRARWAEKRIDREIDYAEAKANGDNEGVREYWKWIKRNGASTKEYYSRVKAKRRAAKKIAANRDRITSAETRQRAAEIKADAQCKLPENIMIEHLEDYRDGIGWSIAALAKKRFHVRRTLKINDSNGDMFCEVNDDGESLLNAVKQLISQYDRSNNNK